MSIVDIENVKPTQGKVFCVVKKDIECPNSRVCILSRGSEELCPTLHSNGRTVI